MLHKLYEYKPRYDCQGDCADETTNRCVPRTGATDMCTVPTQLDTCTGIKDQTQCSTLGCPLDPEECIALDTQIGCCR